MIEIKDKKLCSGCEACCNICPQGCIHMVEDEEGFRYPKVDLEKCIHCGLCEKVCPLRNEATNTTLEETKFYAAYNKNQELLHNSSSGGIFSVLAEAIIKDNGVVYGVVQTDTFDVHFERAENMDACKKFMGSKYLQANVKGILKEVLVDLKEGKKVLFTGTPCQIAGLYNFLKKKYSNLYTCDIVCHGVPSNKVYRKYIEYLEQKYQKRVKNIKFRDKSEGWKPNRLKIEFADNSCLYTRSQENIFQKGFLENYYLRKSCYSCKYAKLPRIGDISLADFWGYEGKLENNNQGLSIVVVSTPQGKQLFEKISNNLHFHEVEKEYVLTKSRHVYMHPAENVERDEFLKKIEKHDIEELANRYYMKPNIFKKIRKRVKRIIKK